MNNFALIQLQPLRPTLDIKSCFFIDSLQILFAKIRMFFLKLVFIAISTFIQLI